MSWRDLLAHVLLQAASPAEIWASSKHDCIISNTEATAWLR